MHSNMVVILLTLITLFQAEGIFDGKSFEGTLTHFVSEKPCVRLFSNTFDIGWKQYILHSHCAKFTIGCRTTDKSSRGVLLEIRNIDEISEIKDYSYEITLVVHASLFSTLLFSSNTDNIKGVFVYDDPTPLYDEIISYSTDSKTPQGDGTPQSTLTPDPSYTWNSGGNGYMYQSLRQIICF